MPSSVARRTEQSGEDVVIIGFMSSFYVDVGDFVYARAFMFTLEGLCSRQRVYVHPGGFMFIPEGLCLHREGLCLHREGLCLHRRVLCSLRTVYIYFGGIMFIPNDSGEFMFTPVWFIFTLDGLKVFGYAGGWGSKTTAECYPEKPDWDVYFVRGKNVLNAHVILMVSVCYSADGGENLEIRDCYASNSEQVTTLVACASFRDFTLWTSHCKVKTERR